jgi:hypothetical protein
MRSSRGATATLCTRCPRNVRPTRHEPFSAGCVPTLARYDCRVRPWFALASGPETTIKVFGTALGAGILLDARVARSRGGLREDRADGGGGPNLRRIVLLPSCGHWTQQELDPAGAGPSRSAQGTSRRAAGLAAPRATLLRRAARHQESDGWVPPSGRRFLPAATARGARRRGRTLGDGMRGEHRAQPIEALRVGEIRLNDQAEEVAARLPPAGPGNPEVARRRRGGHWPTRTEPRCPRLQTTRKRRCVGRLAENAARYALGVVPTLRRK